MYRRKKIIRKNAIRVARNCLSSSESSSGEELPSLLEAHSPVLEASTPQTTTPLSESPTHVPISTYLPM